MFDQILLAPPSAERQNAHVPKVFEKDGYVFFFYSNERQEPAHVHVEKGDGEAKLWLQPVEVVYAHGLTPSEQRRARELTVEHQATFLERWNEHFRR